LYLFKLSLAALTENPSKNGLHKIKEVKLSGSREEYTEC
jgi:hypothetical protein